MEKCVSGTWISMNCSVNKKQFWNRNGPIMDLSLDIFGYGSH
jgi:hypothetical protein